MKYLLIQTGGTISSEVENGVIKPGKSNYLRENLNDFLSVTPMLKLSECMNFADLVAIVKQVSQNINAADGVIIGCGTDALAYFAAFFAQCFSGTDKPIVLVSADFPPLDPRSNAAANLEGSRAVIESGKAGVFVSYQNKGESTKIHFASRLLAPRSFDGYLSSIKSAIAGTVEKGRFSLLEEIISTPSPMSIYGESMILNITFNKVLLAPPYLGADYNFYVTRGYPVILEGYHSGSLDLSKAAINCEAYLVGGLNGDVYESRLNCPSSVQIVNNITAASLYVKRCMSADKDFLFKNYNGEFI